MISGQINATAPDYSKASAACRRLYRIIVGQQTRDAMQELQAQKPLTGKVGTCKLRDVMDTYCSNRLFICKLLLTQVEFRNVNFTYASRPDAKVLDNFNLVIPAGATVALVGESGCGNQPSNIMPHELPFIIMHHHS